jgi:hypothetical protein
MGLAACADGKLAALTLSERGGPRLTSPEAVHVPAAMTKVSVGYSQASPYGGANRGANMTGKKFSFAKGSARGMFSVKADDGTEFADISMDDLLDELEEYFDDVLSARGYRVIPGTGYNVQPGVKASARLDSLVRQGAKDNGITLDESLQRVIVTDEGKVLWEQKRLQELEESRKLSR